MIKENIKSVKKVWGSELWIVNNDKYCGKLLNINKGASSSLHYHPVKMETFYCIKGQVGLEIEDKGFLLNSFSRPKTIMPGERHQFTGLTSATIVEISTHHDDNDVERLEESRP